MLEGLRAAQGTWAGRAVMGLVMVVIVVSFAIWGVGDIFRGFNADQVAQVGDIKIAATTYRQAYETELQALQQQARRQITNEEAHRSGLDARVLARLVSEAVLDGRIHALGLAISDAQVAKTIRGDPAFAGPGGAFDRARFNAAIRNAGYSEQSFVREQRLVYLRQELIQALVGGLVVPTAAVEALHRYESEIRSLDFLVVPASAAGEIPAPDEAALQAYFEPRTKDFAAPQYRKLVVVALTPAALAKPGEVSDADARALYDEVKEQRYGTPERRTLQQVVFPTEQDAASAAARLGSGAHFADIAGDKAVDLGTVTKDAIFDKAVADAAFALPPDGVSAPVKGAFGTVLVHVAAIDPAHVRPFDEVAGDLEQEIARKRAGDRLKALHDKIEDARSGGKSLAEAARAAEAEARTIEAVDAAGLDRDGKPIEGLPDRDALVKAAFASDIGVDNDIVQSRDGSTVWFEVSGIEPARPRTLAEVKPKVEAAWRTDELARRLTAKTDDLVKAVDGGQPLDQVASSLGLPAPTHVGDAKRSGATGLDAAVVARAFDLPIGKAGSAPGPGEARVLFKVLDSAVPPLDPEAPHTKQIEDRYRDSLSESVLEAYVAKVGARLGARVNQEALRAASGGS